MHKDFIIGVIEVESKLVGCCVKFIFLGNEELELGGEKVSPHVVLPSRHHGAGHGPVSNIYGPVFCDSFKSRFYGC